MSLVDRLRHHIGWMRRSSSLRLALRLSVIFACAMAVAIFAAFRIGGDVLEKRVDASLRTLAAGVVLAEGPADTQGAILRAPGDLSDLPRPFARVALQGGGTVELDRDFRRSDLWRIVVARDRSGAPVVVAASLADGEEAFELLAGILWTTVLVVVALTLGLGFGAGLLAQRRVALVRDTLERLARGDLSARTGHAGRRDDLDDIARQVDITAGELERLVAQTRHLGASIAHDLRTPLARLRARLDALPEGAARADALEEASRLSDIFDTIMRVARIEAAQGDAGLAPVDLAELVQDVAETFGPVVEDAGRHLHLDLSGAGIVRADRQMLVQALANLIQNALVHGGSQITLSARGGALSVADTGPGVDPALYDEILKPMVRLDAARRSEGSGLGLALVRAVAHRHGAELILSPHRPSGLCVTLRFANL